MSEERIKILVNLAGNVARKARQYAKSMQRFERSTSTSLRRVRRAARAAGRGIKRMGNRYTALAATAAGTVAVRSIASMEDRLTALGIQAGVTDDRLASLKKRIFDVAKQPSVRLDPQEILAGLEKVVSITGNFDVAVGNINNIAHAIRASGSAGEDVGALVANLFQKFNIRDAKTMAKMLGLLSQQGEKGAFELKDLATQGNRVTAAFAATGRTGTAAVREMGALLQMIQRNTGSADEASTAFERMLATITQEKVSELQKNGIQIWDQKQLAKGNKVARSIPDIIKDIVIATNGDVQKLSSIFDIRALRAVNAFVLDFKKNKGFKDFNDFLHTEGNSAQLFAESARQADTLSASLEGLATTIKAFADKELLGALSGLKDGLNALLDEQAVASGRKSFIDRIRASRQARVQRNTQLKSMNAGSPAATLEDLIPKGPLKNFNPPKDNGSFFLGHGPSAQTQPPRGEIVIRIDQEGRAKVKSMRSEDLDLKVDSGPRLVNQ